MRVVSTMAKPVYIATNDDAYTMQAVNTLPTSAQTDPAAMPPMSAALNCTLVLGMNTYMKVKVMVTIRYGRILPTALNVQANGLIALIHSAKGLLSALASRPSATARRMGPTIITARYSVKRRRKLRGRSTRHRWLKLFSTF